MEIIRKATLEDLPYLEQLEQQSFTPKRQFNKTALRRSILSKTQLVYVLFVNETFAGAAIIHVHKRAWRIYSVAVLPSYRNQKLGKKIMDFIINEAKKEYVTRILLEVDAGEDKLISFYEKSGFIKTKRLIDYYGTQEDAQKMVLTLNPASNKLANIIVTDLDLPWLQEIKDVIIITPDQYINEKRFMYGEYRVFNLCRSYQYQTNGYYISLFAQAREQRAIPNFTTLEDFMSPEVLTSIGEEVDGLINQALRKVEETSFTLEIVWGKTRNEPFAVLAAVLAKLFRAPFLSYTFIKEKRWLLREVKPLSIENLEIDEFFLTNAKKYFAQKKFHNATFKNYKYDLAILIDDEDKSPPSNKTALRKFKQAAEKIGLYTEFITKEDYHRLKQFDALFIRTTTNPNNYTYDFSRLAYAEGLVVIDDPFSILKCANKVFLHEAMKKHNVRTPQTLYVTKETNIDELIMTLSLPIILKQPDSAASLGVFKVTTKENLVSKLAELFIASEIIIAQQYLQSEFDWRVGIINNEILFVCQYFMAKDHWQIYNWSAHKKDDLTGDVVTFLESEAPANVKAMALAASTIIGDGFYGVDIKEVAGKLYVIEVNDNPSVDYNVEDVKLKDTLYLLIVKDIMRRIEEARNIKRRESLPILN